MTVKLASPPVAENGLGKSGHRCDHCGSAIGTMSNWDWPGRPDGIWLHPCCEAAWCDSNGQMGDWR
jgi:hypothetical protein